MHMAVDRSGSPSPDTGTERKQSSFNLIAISMAGCHVLVSDKPISNLGVSFDLNLSMCNQVHRVVRSTYFHLRSIGLARKMLTVAATKQLIQALVISCLDYCNSLLTEIPTSLMSRLEMVQHRAAHLIFRSSGHCFSRTLLPLRLFVLGLALAHVTVITLSDAPIAGYNPTFFNRYLLLLLVFFYYLLLS